MLTLDVKNYLQQIHEANWKLGNGSKYALSGNYFFKRLTEKSPSKVHDFLLDTKSSSKINSIVSKFVGYCYLSDSDCHDLNYKGENAKYNHVYVFEKVNFVKLDVYLERKNIKEYMRVLDDLFHFFNVLNIVGITYHDVCWDNIGWNKTTNKLCVIDLDSMVESANTYESLQNLGTPLFHTSFLKFREKYATMRSPLYNIQYLNLCICHNIFFAFVLGLSQNDKRFSLMEETKSVNTFVAKYIEGDYIETLENGQTIDIEFVKILIKATQIVSSYIEGTYSGNPFKYIVLLSNGLVNKIPAKPIQHKPVFKPIFPVATFTSNVNSGNAPLSVRFYSSSLNATEWRWNFGDGTYSTVQNPTHTYNAVGNYTVNLTASNANGTNSTSCTINVLTKTIGQIITSTLQNSLSKKYKISSKKILIFGILLFLLVLIVNASINGTDTNSNISPMTKSQIASDGTDTNSNISPITKSQIASDGTDTNSNLNSTNILEQPVLAADFLADPTSGEVPLTVTFTDHSTGSPTSWKWDFGDNVTSMKQSPIHTYTTAGVYTVKEIVANEADKDMKIKTDYINVTDSLQIPDANFSVSETSGETPMVVKFTDESTESPTEWKWDFGDGNISNEPNPEHTYSTDGVYTVKETVTNEAGQDIETKTDYITVTDPLQIPYADFSVSETSGEAPLTVKFTDESTESPTEWKWDFGDGNISNEPNPEHTYSTDGVYTVKETVTNEAGQNIETKTDYITVKTPEETSSGTSKASDNTNYPTKSEVVTFVSKYQGVSDFINTVSRASQSDHPEWRWDIWLDQDENKISFYYQNNPQGYDSIYFDSKGKITSKHTTSLIRSYP